MLRANIGNVQVADTLVDRVMNAHDDLSIYIYYGDSIQACVPIGVLNG